MKITFKKIIIYKVTRHIIIIEFCFRFRRRNEKLKVEKEADYRGFVRCWEIRQFLTDTKPN